MTSNDPTFYGTRVIERRTPYSRFEKTSFVFSKFTSVKLIFLFLFLLFSVPSLQPNSTKKYNSQKDSRPTSSRQKDDKTWKRICYVGEDLRRIVFFLLSLRDHEEDLCSLSCLLCSLLLLHSYHFIRPGPLLLFIPLYLLLFLFFPPVSSLSPSLPLFFFPFFTPSLFLLLP